MALTRNLPAAVTRLLKNEEGQLTVEFVVVFPVILVIVCVAVNALMFFSECAAFDVQAKNAIRTYATSPASTKNSDQESDTRRTERIAQDIENSLSGSFKRKAETVSVTNQDAGKGMTTYYATLEYQPNLFGISLRQSVFGVSFPKLHHTAALTVSTYKPGMLF